MTNRNTIQCSLVFDAVKDLHCHATADEVYEEIRLAYPNISRGTVYRNLNRLCETGKIRKIVIPDGADRFDHRVQEHYHVKCEKCGRVFDVDMDVVANFDDRIRDAHGFRFTGCDVIFRGVCPDCQRAENQKSAAGKKGDNTDAIRRP